MVMSEFRYLHCMSIALVIQYLLFMITISILLLHLILFIDQITQLLLQLSQHFIHFLLRHHFLIKGIGLVLELVVV